MVLPSPISSARIPFRLLLNSETSHSRPCNKCMGTRYNTVQHTEIRCTFTFLFCIHDIPMYLKIRHDHLLPHTFQSFIYSHSTPDTTITVNSQGFIVNLEYRVSQIAKFISHFHCPSVVNTDVTEKIAHR
jgi:hypothetical protein